VVQYMCQEKLSFLEENVLISSSSSSGHEVRPVSASRLYRLGLPLPIGQYSMSCIGCLMSYHPADVIKHFCLYCADLFLTSLLQVLLKYLHFFCGTINCNPLCISTAFNVLISHCFNVLVSIYLFPYFTII